MGYLGSSIDRLSREEAAELRVGGLSSNLQLALERAGIQPCMRCTLSRNTQPPSFGVFVQHRLRRPLLTLHPSQHMLTISEMFGRKHHQGMPIPCCQRNNAAI